MSTEDDDDPDTDDEGGTGTKAEKTPGALEHPKTDGGDTVALPEGYPKVCPACPLNQLQHAGSVPAVRANIVQQSMQPLSSLKTPCNRLDEDFGA